jgi:GNAT superfamily N-acetyltransferase
VEESGTLKSSMSITYRRGKLEDLQCFRFPEDLGIAAESIEFNVVGMSHEFWIAVEDKTILAITVLGRATPNEFTVMYLRVANARKGYGIGSSLIRTILETYSSSEISVIPFAGTEQFYEHLGFKRTACWEMRRKPTVTSML